MNTTDNLGQINGGRALTIPVLSDLREASIRPQQGEPRFAFLMHPLNAQGYADFDASLTALEPMDLDDLVQRLSGMIEPFRLSSVRVISDTGCSAYGEFFVVPRTATDFLLMAPEQAMNEVKQALHMARTAGAQIVGLGAFTSIVTKGGVAVAKEGVPVTTGNSYAAVSSVEAIRVAFERLGKQLGRETTVAIVGATGAIGRAMALLLSEDVGRVILVGNPARKADAVRRRLLNVSGDIVRHLAEGMVENRAIAPGTLSDYIGCALERGLTIDSPSGLIEDVVNAWENAGRLVLSQNVSEGAQEADIVVTATSATGTLVETQQLKHGAVVCDVSRPANVTTELAHRPDVLVIDGGVIAVPGLPFLGKFGLDRGLAYACMAETMMLALDRHFENTSLGTDITPTSLCRVRDAAKRHGFSVGRLRGFGRLLDAKDFEKVLAGRATEQRE